MIILLLLVIVIDHNQIRFVLYNPRNKVSNEQDYLLTLYYIQGNNDYTWLFCLISLPINIPVLLLWLGGLESISLYIHVCMYSRQ